MPELNLKCQCFCGCGAGNAELFECCNTWFCTPCFSDHIEDDHDGTD